MIVVARIGQRYGAAIGECCDSWANGADILPAVLTIIVDVSLAPRTPGNADLLESQSAPTVGSGPGQESRGRNDFGR